MAAKNEDPLVSAFLSQMEDEPAEGGKPEEGRGADAPAARAERGEDAQEGRDGGGSAELRHDVAVPDGEPEGGAGGDAGHRTRRRAPAVGPGKARTAFFAAAALALAAMAAAIASAVIGSPS